MKIPSYLSSKISDAYLRQAQATKQREGNNSRSVPISRKVKQDEIVLSPRATEVRRLEELAKDVPEVRQDKVEAVKTQIESRTYNVNGKLVAKSIADLLGCLSCETQVVGTILADAASD